MKKHITDCQEQMTSWFPEISDLLFKHFRVIEVTVKVRDRDLKPVLFKFTTSSKINPLADYRSRS
jgi:hypothetical protein